MPVPLHTRYKLYDPGNILWPAIGLYQDHLSRGRYTDLHSRRCIASVLHFGDWLRAEGVGLTAIDEACVNRFLVGHLPTCGCRKPVPVDLILNRAAINTLLRILRRNGLIPIAPPDNIDAEIGRFRLHMEEVWGLQRSTRDERCRVIRRLLREHFDGASIELDKISPASVRRFVLGTGERGTNAIRFVGGSVRCYFRYRTMLGDQVAHLLHAVPRPACWRDAQLPDALSATALEQLLSAFDEPCPSRRRGYAIVRCLADLGLRSSEVVRLTLDDIDWKEGVVRLAAGKTRRSYVLPLSVTTGEAIVDYILHERPETTRREVFVRHVAPLGEPVGRRVVQKVLHAAYARLGWDHSRVHILRHTLASRLVNSGVPMKQVADVLRHRSIDTTAGYTRLDVARLSAVAMPWPGAIA